MLCAAGMAFLISGCVDINYVGQEFAPTPDSQPIAYFNARAELPQGEYRIIGRAVLTAPDGVNGWEIREKLEARAREVGADAVCQVSARRVAVGLYETPDMAFEGPADLQGPTGNSISGMPIQENSYGETVPVRGEYKLRYEIEVKALFLKNKAELETLLAERREELDALAAQPVPESTKADAEAIESADVTEKKVEEKDANAKATDNADVAEKKVEEKDANAKATDNADVTEKKVVESPFPGITPATEKATAPETTAVPPKSDSPAADAVKPAE